MSELQKTSQRLIWMDIIRGLLIISVVVGHATGRFNAYIYQFHMGAFFIASGYMASQEKRTVPETIFYKFFTTFLPVMTTLCGFQLIAVVLAKTGTYGLFFTQDLAFNSTPFVLKEFLLNGNCYTWWLGAAWFILVLFLVSILHRCIYTLCQKQYGIPYAVITFALFFLGYAVAGGMLRRWNLDLVLIAQFYYGTGIFLSKIPMEKLNSKNWFGAGAVATFCIMQLVSQYGHWSVDYPSRRFNNPLIDILIVYNGAIFIYSLSRLLESLPYAKNGLAYLGKNTLPIVLLHFMCFKIGTLVMVLLNLAPAEAIAEFLPPRGLDLTYWWFFAGAAIVGSLSVWWLVTRFKICRIFLGQEKNIYRTWYYKLVAGVKYIKEMVEHTPAKLDSHKSAVKKDMMILLAVTIGIFVLYGWTVDFAIAGDGLFHMMDQTPLKTPADWIGIFFQTAAEQGKAPYITDTFLRPVFNDLIVTGLKWISNGDVQIIRTINLCIVIVNAWLAYYICKKLSESKFLIPACGAILLGYGLTYYSGVYEFGLSFSQWLTMFALLSFFFLVEYEQTEKVPYLILSLLFTFIAVFTKESAVSLGVALTFYLWVHSMVKHKKPITRKVFFYGMVQLAIIVLYFVCRMHKLGSLTGIVGGIEGDISVSGMLEKIVGYALLLFNIPTVIIPEYMMMPLRLLNTHFVGLFLVLFIGGVAYIIIRAFKKPVQNLDSWIGILVFIICIIPVFKVTRNAPYYGDFAVIGGLILLSSIRFPIEKRRRQLLKTCIGGFFCCFIVCSISLQAKSWDIYGTYLVQNQKDTIVIRDGLLEQVSEYPVIYEGIGFDGRQEKEFIFNHGPYGSFINVNINRNAKVLRPTMEMFEKETLNQAAVVDYAENMDAHGDIAVRAIAADTMGTKLLRVVPEQKDTYENPELYVVYQDEGKNWLHSADLQVCHEKGIQELFFVIPDNVEYNVLSDYVNSAEIVDITQFISTT